MRPILTAAAVLALAFPAAAAGQTAAAAPQAAGSGEAAADALRPGDVVRVRIWREPDLSGEFPVDADGVVIFPRLGPVHVMGYSGAALREHLVEEYGRFLNHASVEVTLLRRLQVLGAIRSPGLYPVDGTLTIGDVLALAGGATPQGDPRRVELVRDGERVTARLATDATVATTPIRSGDQLFVPERSWLARNTAVVAGVGSAIATVLVTLLAR
jgi:protein involved in polysaccharide export with SLBB domain